MALTFNAATAKLDRATALNTSVGATAKLIIYAGSVPTDADAALGSPTVLSTHTCAATFGTAANSAGTVTLTAGAIANVNATATGTATFFRLFKTNGTTVVMQGTVGTSGADLNLNTTSIVSGGPVAISSFVITEG